MRTFGLLTVVHLLLASVAFLIASCGDAGPSSRQRKDEDVEKVEVEVTINGKTALLPIYCCAITTTQGSIYYIESSYTVNLPKDHVLVSVDQKNHFLLTENGGSRYCNNISSRSPPMKRYKIFGIVKISHDKESESWNTIAEFKLPVWGF